MRRGQQALVMEINSSIEKLFTVTGTQGPACNFTIAITKVFNTMEAEGKKVEYNSQLLPDSVITGNKATTALAGKVITIGVDKDGIITDAKDNRLPVSNNDSASGTYENLASYSAAPQLYASGVSFELLPFFNFKQLKKGDTWADSTADGETTKVLHYTASSITDSLLTVTFSGTVLRTDSSADDGINQKSRVAGTEHGEIIIDTRIGIIISQVESYDMKGITEIMGIKLNTTVNNTITETVVKKAL